MEQSLSTVIVGSHWPGRLWRVRVKALGDMSGLVAQPGYWRATALELVEEIPGAALFGPHGDSVVDLLSQIRTLSPEQAEALASNADPSAWNAYSRAWIRWSETREFPRPAASDEDWEGVLAAPSKQGAEQSPIHSGFKVISTLIRQRARSLEGNNAFRLVFDNDSTEEVLTSKWQGAHDAFLQAAMALGAPAYVCADDVTMLTRAWRRVIQSEAGNRIIPR
ncbi:hypothetical protein [Cupriavidus sp. YAF13]|uniref:hypothetical protein n=1 Tax=Cupriavidus sp. YAF13 TaxID=3233075 RepID=UPI003F929C4B